MEVGVEHFTSSMEKNSAINAFMAELEHVLQLVAPSKAEISQIQDTLQVTDFIFFIYFPI